MLSPPEQAVLARLAVFRGGFTLAAAEAVCVEGDEAQAADVLDLLAGLVNKSLVVAEPVGEEEARFSLLEVIREYALERLVAAERKRPRDRHLAFF